MATKMYTRNSFSEFEGRNTRETETDNNGESGELVDEVLDVILQQYPKKPEREVVRQIRDIVNTNEIKIGQSDLYSEEYILNKEQNIRHQPISQDYKRERARKLAEALVKIADESSFNLDSDVALALIYATEFVEGDELELIEHRLRSYSERQRKLISSDQEEDCESSWEEIRDSIDVMLDHHENLFDIIEDDVKDINKVKEEHIKSELRMYL